METSLMRANTSTDLARSADGQVLALVGQVYEVGLRELAALRSAQDLVDAWHRVVAVEGYLRRALRERADKLRAQNLLAELRLRQERALGQWLARNINHRGGGDRRSQSRDRTAVGDLPEGVTKNESSRFQRIAAIPEAVFEHYLITTRDAQEELTTAGLLRLVRGNGRPRQAGNRECAGCTAENLIDLVGRRARFGTIYADPPWPYDTTATRGAAAGHYSSMSLDELAALPVAELAAENAHLHLWTTNAFLFECSRLFRAWGFEYRGVFIWVKPVLGPGDYWRVAHEFLLLGTRGDCPFRDRSQRSWQGWEGGEHSAKAEAARTLIERVSPGPYLELFGRHPTDGWVVWGDQIERSLFDGSVGRL